jgi:hypothetical protein
MSHSNTRRGKKPSGDTTGSDTVGLDGDDELVGVVNLVGLVGRVSLARGRRARAEAGGLSVYASTE